MEVERQQARLRGRGVVGLGRVTGPAGLTVDERSLSSRTMRWRVR